MLALTAPPGGALAAAVVGALLGQPEGVLPDPLPVGVLHRSPLLPDLEAALDRSVYCVLDLETTGLSPERSTILEIGAVRVVELRVEGRFSTLVNPGSPIPPRITSLTGIDDRMVAGAPELGAALQGFLDWLGSLPCDALVAHNAPFDDRFLRGGLAREGFPSLELPVLCTRRLSRRLLPALRRLSLDALGTHLEIPNPARHRALGDAEVAAGILLHLLGLARGLQPGLSLQGLLDLQERPPPRRKPVRLGASG